MRKHAYAGMRIMALIMTIVLAVTYLPILTDSYAHAASDEGRIETEVVKLTERENERNRAEALSDLETELGIEDGEEGSIQEKKSETISGSRESAPKEQGKSRMILVSGNSAKGLSLDATTGKAIGLITVSSPNKSGYITITGPELNTQYTYEGIYVGNEHPSVSLDAPKVANLSGSSAFSVKLDMKDYNVGYHTVYVLINQNGSPYAYDYVDYVPTYIYKKASNNLSWYWTGKKNVKAYYGGSTYYSYSGEYLDVYMDYKKSGKKWSKKVYGPVSTSSYSVSKKTGLKARSTYYVRMMFGKKFEYNGKNYLFTGRQKSKASSKKKIKTAYSKPRVKNIKITGGKTIVRKYKVHYANRIRYRVVNGIRYFVSSTPLYHTYRSYYTRYKVIVSFKKKQGIAGVQIKTGGGTVQKNGNKKKYKARYFVSGKKKGKKIGVKVRCFRSKTYGGYSGWKSTKARV